MGSAGGETDAHSVCRVPALMSPFPSLALSPWHPCPMEDGVTACALSGHPSLMPWPDSEEGALSYPAAPLWVPRGENAKFLEAGRATEGQAASRLTFLAKSL